MARVRITNANQLSMLACIQRVILIAALCLAVVAPPAEAARPGNPGKLDLKKHFKASGQGAVTTFGSITDGSSVLSVQNSATWAVDQGIRVRRAGRDNLVNDADTTSGWSSHPEGSIASAAPAPGTPGGLSISCTAPTTTNGPVDLCSITFGTLHNFRYDELRIWLNPSVATTDEQLQVVLFTDSGEVEHSQMEVPAMPAGWTEVYLRIQGEALESVRRLALRCHTACAGMSVQLDDVWLVEDLLGVVSSISGGGGKSGPKQFTLKTGAGTTLTAGRTVTNATVYHDDTRAIVAWLDAAATSTQSDQLFAPNGVYYVNQVHIPEVDGRRSLRIPSDVVLSCQSAAGTVFRSTGGSNTGAHKMFAARAASPANITVQTCGFDPNGWNQQDFLTLLDISPRTPGIDLGMNIRVLNNLIDDSNPPARTDCDFDQDPCATLQRQYITVLGVTGAFIEGNRLVDGGRIKAGGHRDSSDIIIRGNSVDFVNDNAITISQAFSGTTRNVQITDNVIRDAVATAIFFGGDGDTNANTPGLKTFDITIARNRIEGFFHSAIKGTLGEEAARIHVTDNVVRASRARPAIASVDTNGIDIKRGTAWTDPATATEIDVSRNTVITTGAFGVLEDHAIQIEGPLTNLTVAGNVAGCAERLEAATPTSCLGAPFEKGIRLRKGPILNATVQGNRIFDAGIALLVADLGLGGSLTDGSIVGNTFGFSRASGEGQITLRSLTGQTIAASIDANVIHDGAGWAILCTGTGQFLLTFGTNEFAGNAKGIQGCGS